MRLEGEARPAVRRGRIAMRRAFVVPRALRGQRLGLASGLTLLASRKLQPGKAESWYLGRGAVQTRLFFKRGVAALQVSFYFGARGSHSNLMYTARLCLLAETRIETRCRSFRLPDYRLGGQK